MPDVNAALRALAAGSVVRLGDEPAPADSADSDEPAADLGQGTQGGSVDFGRDADISTALRALRRDGR